MTAAPYNPVGRTEVRRLRQSLDDLFARCNQTRDPEILGDLSKYACVRTCGFLERSILSLARSKCEHGAWGEGQAFALSWLERAPNPRAAEVLRLVRRFSPAWELELKSLLDIDERAQALNALVGIRNDIAHGRNQGISLRQVREYKEVCVLIVDWLQDKLEPQP